MYGFINESIFLNLLSWFYNMSLFRLFYLLPLPFLVFETFVLLFVTGGEEQCAVFSPAKLGRYKFINGW